MTGEAAVAEKLELQDQVSAVLRASGNERSELIPLLQKVQDRVGYVPEGAVREVARFLRLSPGEVFGVVTFYAQFKLKPPALNTIKVCLGTACHVRGGGRVLQELERLLGIKPGETTPDGQYGLERVACIGACAIGPAIVIGQETYGGLTPSKVAAILKGRKDRAGADRGDSGSAGSTAGA